MSYIMQVAPIVIGLMGSVCTWMLGIRPYLCKHHEGYRTGANLLVAAWVDWQNCGELTKRLGDSTGRRLYWTFVGFQLTFAAGLAILLLSENLWH